MNRDRYEEWVKRSFRFARDPKHDLDLPHHVQLLGIVDADIHGIRKDDLFASDGTELEDADGILLAERAQILAHLWVLGAYEYVRMLSQRIRDEPNLVHDSSVTVVSETKHLFERIRIPLAKREAARKHPSDFQVALPGIGSRGLAWRMAENVIITQEDLADAFLHMLSSIKPPRDTKSES